MKPADGSRKETKKERAGRLRVEKELRRRKREARNFRTQMEPRVLRRYLSKMKKILNRKTGIRARWIGREDRRRIRMEIDKPKRLGLDVVFFEPDRSTYQQAAERARTRGEEVGVV